MFGRAKGKLYMSAMREIACLEGKDWAPAQACKFRAQLCERGAPAGELIVRGLRTPSTCPPTYHGFDWLMASSAPACALLVVLKTAGASAVRWSCQTFWVQNREHDSFRITQRIFLRYSSVF